MTVTEMPAGQTYRGLSAEQRRTLRREKLIDAARVVYGARGIRGATVKAVCEAAGLTERYFYESFASSDLLLIAAFERACDEVLAIMAKAAAATRRPGRHRVEAVLTEYCRCLMERPDTARIFIVEIAGLGGAVECAFDKGLERFAEIFEDAWGRTLPPDPLLRTGAIGGMNRIVKAWVASGFERPVDEVVAIAMKICVALAP